MSWRNRDRFGRPLAGWRRSAARRSDSLLGIGAAMKQLPLPSHLSPSVGPRNTRPAKAFSPPSSAALARARAPATVAACLWGTRLPESRAMSPPDRGGIDAEHIEQNQA